jgi:MYXO-CTERM domain-containing protein
VELEPPKRCGTFRGPFACTCERQPFCATLLAMLIARRSGLSFGAAALLACSLSRADLPPQQPETCTIDAQQKSGETCVKCPASFKRPDACRDSYDAQGYKQRCKTKGASVWSEIWCRASSEQDAAAPLSPDAGAPSPAGAVTPPGKGGCGACAAGADPSGAGAWLSGALAALFGIARRRRAARR